MRAKDIFKIPKKHGWEFRTKLELAVQALRPAAQLTIAAGKIVWIVADGAFAKRPFLRPLRRMGVTVVSRLRKAATLWSLPTPPKTRRRGRPRKYGTKRIHSKRRAAHLLGWEQVQCFVYGQLVTKTIKTFLATYPPADGLIRVVIVLEDHGCEFFFSTDPDSLPREIIAAGRLSSRAFTT